MIKENRYSLQMINRNGYTIKRESNSIEALKQSARHFPIECFFIWIYDKINDEMVCQNTWSKKFRKCNNETFIPYY